jgi:hypothetical protein
VFLERKRLDRFEDAVFVDGFTIANSLYGTADVIEAG